MNFSDIKSITIPEGSVNRITDPYGVILWQSEPIEPPYDPDAASQYFYIENLTDETDTLTIKKTGDNADDIEVYKSTDGTTWTSMGNTTVNGITATIPTNSKLYLKADTTSWGYNSSLNRNYINVTGAHAFGGNILSLLWGDDFQEYNTFPNGSGNNFSFIFSGDTDLWYFNNLVLPPTTLVIGCYRGMFKDCVNLHDTFGTKISHVTTFDEGSCKMMFYGCTSLVSPMILNANATLANGCCQEMYMGCTGLTHYGLLQATTLADYCYYSMFENCTSIKYGGNLPATTLTQSCYYRMFAGCTSLSNAPKISATTLANSCCAGMFIDCHSLTKAPELKATTLVQNCYAGMFNRCYNLNEVKIYAQDPIATGQTSAWLNSVAAYGDFYNYGGASFTTGTSGIPSGWTVHTS